MTAIYSKANHPTYAQMITEAVKEIKDKKGCSRVAICNYVTKKYQLESSHRVNQLVSKSIVSAVESGKLIRKTGSGANGRFFSNIENSKGSGDNKNIAPKKNSAKFPKRTSGVNVLKAKNVSVKKATMNSTKSVSKTANEKGAKPKTNKTPKKVVAKKSSSATKKINSIKKSIIKKNVAKQAVVSKKVAASKPKKATKKESVTTVQV